MGRRGRETRGRAGEKRPLSGLEGRFIHARDDVDALVRRAEEIRRDNLHTLTVRT